MFRARSIARRRFQKPFPNKCGLPRWGDDSKVGVAWGGVAIGLRSSTTNADTTFQRAREDKQRSTTSFRFVLDATGAWGTSIRLQSGMRGLRLVRNGGGTGLFGDNGIVMASHKPAKVKPLRLKQRPQIDLPCHLSRILCDESSKPSIKLSKTLSISHHKPPCKSPYNGPPYICSSIVPNPGRSNSRRRGRSKARHTSKCRVWVFEDMDDSKINPRKPLCVPGIDNACAGQPLCFRCLNHHVFQRINCIAGLWQRRIWRDGLGHPGIFQRNRNDNDIGWKRPYKTSIQIHNKRKTCRGHSLEMGFVNLVWTLGPKATQERRYVRYPMIF